VATLGEGEADASAAFGVGVLVGEVPPTHPVSAVSDSEIVVTTSATRRCGCMEVGTAPFLPDSRRR
jgi:hypothetical protein